MKTTNKVLVTTDLSTNAKAGLRFAIQLATQQPSKLIFYHVMHSPMPTTLSEEKYMRYVAAQIEATTKKLKSYVMDVYRQMGLSSANPECVVEFKLFVDTAIINYAVSRKVHLICMSTRGAGLFKRIFGTNTSAVLSQSEIPVVAVPHDYRRSRISRILYASDLTSLSVELKRVKKFSDALKSELIVVHYGPLQEPIELKRNLDRIAKQYHGLGVKFKEHKYSPARSMCDHLKGAIAKLKPSVLVLFTKQEKNLFERIFPQSNSELLSFDTTKPLLVFPKAMVSHLPETTLTRNQPEWVASEQEVHPSTGSIRVCEDTV